MSAWVYSCMSFIISCAKLANQVHIPYFYNFIFIDFKSVCHVQINITNNLPIHLIEIKTKFKLKIPYKNTKKPILQCQNPSEYRSTDPYIWQTNLFFSLELCN